MSNNKGGGIGHIIKALVVTTLKLICLVVGVILKIAGLILTKASEILEKLSGYGNH
jgi:hypothetical protein